MNARAFAVLVLVSLWMVGCMVHDVDTKPKAPIKVPDKYGTKQKGARALDERADFGEWWKDFGDPALNTLVHQSLSQSLQLRQTWARLKQAEALADQAGAALHPQVQAQLSAGRSRRVVSFGSNQSSSFTGNNFDASLPVSYELDLWGKMRSSARAAAYDVFASRDEVEAAAMTLAANIAEGWFNVVEQRAKRKLLQAQLLTNEAFLELLILRFGQGQAAAADVLQQRQQVLNVRGQMTLVDAQEQVLLQQLAVLIGRSPGALVTSDRVDLPNLPRIPPTGVPSDLLRRRPDIRAAQRRAVAADYRVGAAIADRYPSIKLQGSVGFSSTKITELLDSFVWSIVGSITQTLWDGGRKAAEVDRTRAVLEERLLAYADKLLNAMLEVESSLVREQQQELNIQELEQQVKTARDTLEATRMRYMQGLTDFLPVLTALQALHQSEQALLTSRRQLLSHRIQLCRALGGSWTQTLASPSSEKEESS